ncbi:MAG: NAD(+) synthase [Lachnospiraceae bacterium]
MKHGFVKTAAVTPKIKVADPIYNATAICEGMKEACNHGAQIIVFPELCLSGYTCGDLFLQECLLKETREQLLVIANATIGCDALIFIGMPLEREHKLYNVAAVLQNGEILAFIPKLHIPNYAEFSEGRYFVPGNTQVELCRFEGEEIPFGANILLETSVMEDLSIACEICEDAWVADTPSTTHALAGATLIVNLSASGETVGKDAYREMLVRSLSGRLLAGYVYASAGEGESTQDMVFSGHNIIAENGSILAQAPRFQNTTVYGDIDVHKICMERRRMTSFVPIQTEEYVRIPFELQEKEVPLTRTFAKYPFVPEEKQERIKCCEDILSIQAYGLKKRYEHIGCRTAIVGISGGLDSTLALLVTVRTFDLLGFDRSRIIAVTMPCFGTTDRTYQNACKMAVSLGVTLREVDIKEAVQIHFRDIHHDSDTHDVTYENSQARERTQVLMDIANEEDGLVIGTGDMSELALGWATYNGDHMSMYGVNAGVPKTLIRYLVQYCADSCEVEALQTVLLDVLHTPVSPELLPPTDGQIGQKTEDIVGPYALHDYFLYYMLRCGYEPSKIYRIAVQSFKGEYDESVILKWMKVFYRRFFTQQFKRSCLPDGPKVGSVGISPRGDLRMPSDACAHIWLQQIDNM